MDHLLEITRPEAIVDREAPVTDNHLDSGRDNSEPACNAIPPITIENYLKDLMAIPRPQVDNSDQLDSIDRVSRNITDCINLTESSLRKKKLRTKAENFSP